jgi:hypothetical protein
MARLGALLLAAVLAGCGSMPAGSAYTEEELAQICVRHGGWWRPDQLTGGYCEMQVGPGLP